MSSDRDWPTRPYWTDGIHVNIRLEEHKLCLLVMIGVRADGRKELVALADGYRIHRVLADLLRDCARRGMRARRRHHRLNREDGRLKDPQVLTIAPASTSADEPAGVRAVTPAVLSRT